MLKQVTLSADPKGMLNFKSFKYFSFRQIHVATETSGLEHGLSCDLTIHKGNYTQRISTDSIKELSSEEGVKENLTNMFILGLTLSYTEEQKTYFRQ